MRRSVWSLQSLLVLAFWAFFVPRIFYSFLRIIAGTSFRLLGLLLRLCCIIRLVPRILPLCIVWL